MPHSREHGARSRAVPASAAAAESWAVSQPPLPADAAAETGATVTAVDCASADFCAVTGNYWPADADLTRPYLAVRNGSVWTSTRAPLPADDGPTTDTYLSDVTCSAPGSCVAVGGYGTGESHPLIETLTDGAWAVQSVAGTQGDLEAVACGSDTCAAVGRADPMTVSDPIFIDRVGGVWRARAVSTPPTSPQAPPTVSGIACPTTRGCYAIGANDKGPLDYRRVDGVWTGSYLPLPTGDNAVTSGAISCPVANRCTALIPATNGASGASVLVAERLHAGAWEPTEVGLALTGTLSAVSIDCPAVDRCAGSVTITTDTGRSRGELAVLSDSGWISTVASAPSDAVRTGDLTLADVSCQANLLCTAVGAYLTSVAGRHVWRPLAESENRFSTASWAGTGLGLPTDVDARETAALTAVSCLAPSCAAVGRYHGRPGSPLPSGGIVAVAGNVPGT